MVNSIELSVKVFLFNDIKLDEITSKICMIIDTALSKNDYYDKFHREKMFKNYSFNMLYPLAKNNIYQKEHLYDFQIRTVDEKLAIYLYEQLKLEKNNDMQILTVQTKKIPQRHIDYVYSITPIVAKFETGYWKGKHSPYELEQRIKNNLIKKYNSYYNVKIDENFDLFTSMKITNQKPISTKYKNISILGDKIKFTIADNKQAQDIINFSIGTGLGEMTSRGFGYINYQWL